MNEDVEKVDEALRKLLGRGPDSCTAEEWHIIRERSKLEVLYPEMWVAFRDHYDGNGSQRRLVKREVLLVSEDMADVSVFVSNLPPEQQRDVHMIFVENPYQPLRLRW